MNLNLKKSTKKGFTLVELIVVIAIIAILAAVSVAGYMGFITQAHTSAANQEGEQVKTALVARTATGFSCEYVTQNPQVSETVTYTSASLKGSVAFGNIGAANSVLESIYEASISENGTYSSTTVLNSATGIDNPATTYPAICACTSKTAPVTTTGDVIAGFYYWTKDGYKSDYVSLI